MLEMYSGTIAIGLYRCIELMAPQRFHIVVSSRRIYIEMLVLWVQGLAALFIMSCVGSLNCIIG